MSNTERQQYDEDWLFGANGQDDEDWRIRKVAQTMVWINEDARVYEQHVAAVAEMAPALADLERSGRDWQPYVHRQIHKELEERALGAR